MQVPLAITSNKGTLRVAYNKSFEKINIQVPVLDTKKATDVFEVVGHGPISLGIKYVSSQQDYNTLKGKCPVSFFNQLFTTKANPCSLYPNTNNLDLLYYDIEVLTKGDGRFPSADKDPIICIGVALNEGEVLVFHDYGKTDEYPYPDGKIIKQFLDYVEQTDPDIYIGYNSYNFDMPYIITRATANNLPWWKLYRLWHKHRNTKNEQNAEFFIKEVANDYLENKPSDFLGRIHYDLFIVDVKRDQLLTDLKDRKMKTLAKHCGFADVIELGDDVKDTQKLMMQDKDRLIKYQDSDVRQTRSISHRYLPLNIALAERLNVPLETMISRSNGTPATLFLLKEMYSRNYFVIDSNADRYQQLYLLHPKFQGALNGLMKSGYFESIHKYDFKNMYPSSMWTWNLGPDTTKIQKLTEYTGEYHFTHIKNSLEHYLILEVPDSNYNRQVHISVDLSRQSFTKKAIETLWEERAKYKQIQKSAKTQEEINDAKTRDNGIKIILNSVTPDTIIPISNANRVDFRPIEELASIKDKYAVISHTDKGKCITGLPNKIWSFTTKNKQMIQIKTRNGRTVNISEDHSIMKLEDNVITAVSGKELKIGDKLLTPKIRLNKSDNIINLLGEVNFIEYVIKESNNNLFAVFSSKLAKQCLTNKKGVRQRICKLLTSESFTTKDLHKTLLAILLENDFIHKLDSVSRSKTYKVTKLGKLLGDFLSENSNSIFLHRISRTYRMKILHYDILSKYANILQVLDVKIQVGLAGRPVTPQIIVDTDFAYMLGAYCSEGSGSRLKGNAYCGIISQKSGPVNIKICKKAYEKTFPTKATISKNGLSINNNISIMFLNYYIGKVHYNKKVPNFIFAMPDEIIKSFLMGEFDGDGNRIYSYQYKDKTNSYRFTTTSKTLISGIALLASILNMHTIIQSEKQIYRIKILGPLDENYVEPTDQRWIKKRKERFQQFGDFEIDIVKSLTHYQYNGKLYDISVPKSQSFVGGLGNLLLHNSCYGINGNTNSIGDLAVSIAVTAMCRWTTTYVLSLIGDSVVELDTDGIVTDRKFEANDINVKIAEKIKEEMNIDESKMIIEDEWGDKKVRAFMYRMKNYVIEIDGNIIKHGVTMKSSSKPKCYDKGINLAIEYIFKRNNLSLQETIDKILDLEHMNISDFVLTTKLNKALNEYQNSLETGKSIIAKVIQQIKEVKNVTIEKDDIVEYIHCIDPKSGQKVPLIPELATKELIDWKKYQTFMEDILVVFQLKQETNLVNFGALNQDAKIEKDINEAEFLLDQPFL